MAQPVPTITTPPQPFMPGSSLDLEQQLIDAIENDDEKTVLSICQQPGMVNVSPTTLGQALVKLVQKQWTDSCNVFFDLPNAQSIPGKGQWGLGHILIETARIWFPEPFQSIQTYPNFRDIEPNGEWGLSKALEVYLEKGFQEYHAGGMPPLEYFEAIVNHPRAHEICASDRLAKLIGNLLILVSVRSENRYYNREKVYDDGDLVRCLLSPSIAHLVQPNGEYALGRALVNAAYSTDPKIVKKMLEHPQATHIISAETPVTEQTKFEQDNEINSFGLKEALYAAVYNGHSIWADFSKIQPLVISQILVFANMHELDLDVNGPLGIAEILTQGLREEDSPLCKNEGLVPLILTLVQEKCGNIQANAANDEDGGLNNALANAAINGKLMALLAILAHPNAKQIPQTSLGEIATEARSHNQTQAAMLIENFSQS